MAIPEYSLMKYAGLAGQFSISILLTLLLGKKIDYWIHSSFPLFVWLLPLLVIIASLVKLVIETNNRKK
jgi:membrane protein DedA with SNARE-associated domain